MKKFTQNQQHIKKFVLKWGISSLSWGFTICNNQTKETTMTENIKKNHEKTTSYKKIKFFWADFPTSGNLPYVKGDHQ